MPPDDLVIIDYHRTTPEGGNITTMINMLKIEREIHSQDGSSIAGSRVSWKALKVGVTIKWGIRINILSI